MGLEVEGFELRFVAAYLKVRGNWRDRGERVELPLQGYDNPIPSKVLHASNWGRDSFWFNTGGGWLAEPKHGHRA